MDKALTKIQIEKELADKLIKLKQVGDSYSDVIQRLLDLKNKLDIMGRKEEVK